MLGVAAALHLQPEFVAVPITCNTSAISLLCQTADVRQTKVGSPFVVQAMQRAMAAKPGQLVAGYEANGGFLTGSDWPGARGLLRALPTRDAVLPMICALLLVRAGQARGPDGHVRRLSKVSDLRSLFPRHTAAAVVDQERDGVAYDSVETGRKILALLRAPDPAVEEIDLAATDSAVATQARELAGRLAAFFPASDGFGVIVRVNYLDGVRLFFADGDIVHLRPSGNAPEFRFYAEADTPPRAQQLCDRRVAVVKRLLAAATGHPLPDPLLHPMKAREAEWR
jgi:phosphomannomutase